MKYVLLKIITKAKQSPMETITKSTVENILNDWTNQNKDTKFKWSEDWIEQKDNILLFVKSSPEIYTHNFEPIYYCLKEPGAEVVLLVIISSFIDVNEIVYVLKNPLSTTKKLMDKFIKLFPSNKPFTLCPANNKLKEYYISLGFNNNYPDKFTNNYKFMCRVIGFKIDYLIRK